MCDARILPDDAALLTSWRQRFGLDPAVSEKHHER